MLTAVEEVSFQLSSEGGDGGCISQFLWETIPQHWGSICEGSPTVPFFASALSAGKAEARLGG